MTTRRDFLVALGATTAAGVLPACGEPPAGPLPVGNVAGLAVGDVFAVEDASVILARDAGGVYALTSICTHAGCDMSAAVGNHEVGATGIRCGCHGSQYDLDGTVTGGPAPQALKHWLVEIAEDGAITVQVGEEVPADARIVVDQAAV